MKRILMALTVVTAFLVALPGYCMTGHDHGDSEMMDGHCPMCGGNWKTPRSWDGGVPAKLPRPKSQDWLGKLQQVFAIEKYSKIQYEADEEKYRVRMPYTMIIPQEQRHIEWITGLFKVYGIPSDGKVLPVKQSSSVDQAYEIGRGLEADLIPRYVWLIRNAEDNTTKRALDTILLQSRMHYTMFTHALEMGGMGMWR